MSPDALPLVVAWLATYAIHSTLLLGTAWVLTTGAVVRSPRARETLWRAALLGGLLTTTLHALVGPPVWRTQLEVETARHVGAPVAPPAVALPAPVLAEASLPPAPASPDPGPAATPSPTTPALPAPWWGLAIWPVGTALLLVRGRGLRRRLGRSLAHRRSLEMPPLDALVRRLEREAGLRRRIRLSACDGLTSPVALGTWRPEICLPRRALDGLPAAQLEAMVAHETAHLLRHDPLWLRVVRGVRALFFFQPLNHLAAARLRDLSEILCDTWAARQADRRLALAECLATVADWIVDRPVPVVAATMARRPSLLGRRIRRLLEDEDGTMRGSRGRGLAVALGLVALVATVAPGVAGPARPASADLEVVADEHAGDTPLAALDRELDLLSVELARVRALLADAGRPDLAARLEARANALLVRREQLARQLEVNGR